MILDNSKLQYISEGYYSGIKVYQNHVSKNQTWGPSWKRMDCTITEEFEFPNMETQISPCILYIDPKCSIPREALRLNNYKITRSPNKADCIVLPNKCKIESSNVCIYQKEEQYYIYNTESALSWDKKLALNLSDSKLIHQGKTWFCTFESTTQLITEYPNMKFIYDSELQKFLNTDNNIDYDTMIQLNEMLDNHDTVGLALKLMSSFNIEINRLQLNILCILHGDRISRCSDKTQVMIKSMLNNLDYKCYNEVDAICSKIKKAKENNNQFIDICSKFVKSYFETYLKDRCSTVIRSLNSAGFTTKIFIE